MTILDPTAYLAELRQKDQIFFRGKSQKVVEFSQPLEEDSIEWIARQFKQFPANQSFQAVEAEGDLFPISPKEATKALKLLRAEEVKIVEKVAEFNQLKKNVDELIGNLYKKRKK